MPAATPIQRRNRALVAFALLTAARVKAISTLRLKHVDLINRRVLQDPREVEQSSRRISTRYLCRLVIYAISCLIGPRTGRTNCLGVRTIHCSRQRKLTLERMAALVQFPRSESLEDHIAPSDYLQSSFLRGQDSLLPPSASIIAGSADCIRAPGRRRPSPPPSSYCRRCRAGRPRHKRRTPCRARRRPSPASRESRPERSACGCMKAASARA
jgi:hypothetical protein